MMKKKIALAIVPLFAVASCTGDIENATSGVSPTDNSQVTQNDAGFYQNQLTNSYSDAVKNGYKGSYDDWIALVKLNETNPQEAMAQAESSGFSGGEMVLGALAGAAVGALAANAMSNNTYSAQRSNNNVNYAYSQPLNKSEEDRRVSNTAVVPNTSNSNSTRTARSTQKQTVSTPVTRTSNVTVSRGGFGGAVSSGG